MDPIITIKLSDEQQNFIDEACTGKNILVDACIGSGKTTAIQYLCNILPSDKNILYLTYNKLLKLDAKERIKQKNVLVTNYHGFAFMMLKRMGITVAISDLIQSFIKNVKKTPEYDILIIDEYQDIDQELSELLEIVKDSNPYIQIIAVGDMEQKIYDKTRLNAAAFIDGFLEDYERLQFTKCFRLSADHAAMLGRIWHKPIDGVNPNCRVETMNVEEVVEFLSCQSTRDVLCLGSRTGKMTDVLNELEDRFPERFNKGTVFASIRDEDGGGTEPNNDSAIFTTYDSSKGLERKICVLFDYTEHYWGNRIDKALTSYEILRNIFCVAASRGKERIIFVDENGLLLSERTLSTPKESSIKFDPNDISSMFDFKYKEDIEQCFSILNIEKCERDNRNLIDVKAQDELIDLSPCVGIYQEAMFFNNYSIDVAIKRDLLLIKHPEWYTEELSHESVEKKVLYKTFLDTRQKRYKKQVEVPYISEKSKTEIFDRLSTEFSRDEIAQVECSLKFGSSDGGKLVYYADGAADVVKDNAVYELKFVSELKHEHYLQCACYMVALKLDKGYLWNTRNNEMYEIHIKDKKAFMDCVAKTVTRGVVSKYYDVNIHPNIMAGAYERHVNTVKNNNDIGEVFAVIDTETTLSDRVMSIGVIIADCNTKEVIDSEYYLIDPEYKQPAMYSGTLLMQGAKKPIVAARPGVIAALKTFLIKNNVTRILAYNASFDKGHLPELDSYTWCDIMRLAAYKQYNSFISKEAECCKTGRLKRNYGVESITRLLTGKANYTETHNAYLDALDELNIVRLLGHNIEKYDIAIVGSSSACINSQKYYQSEIMNKQVDNEIICEELTLEEVETDESVENYKEAVFENFYKTYDVNNEIKAGEDAEDSTNDIIYTSEEAANALECSKSKIYDLIRREQLIAIKRGNRYIISKRSVDAYKAYKKELAERKEKRLIATYVTVFAVVVIAIILLVLL